MLSRVLIVLSFCLMALVPAPGEKPGPASAAAGQPMPITSGRGPSDVVLLMDSSGSMKKTDPRGYRQDAAILFISLLNRNDRIGVISFGETADVLTPLTENIPEHRDRLVRGIRAVSSSRLATNITDAVRQGAAMLRASSRRDRLLLLLSDGKLALGSPERDASSRKELDALLPELEAEGIRIYAIAFTDLADSALLSRLAGRTGGFFRLARNDNDIHLAFSAMFESIKSPDLLPLDSGSFHVDAGVREAIVVITKTPGTNTALLSPDGTIHKASDPQRTSMQWYVSDRFDMVTVHEPAVGNWQVRLSSGQGNAVYIITDLALVAPPEAVIVHPDGRVELQAWMARQGEPLREPDVLNEVSVDADIVTPDDQRLGIALRRDAARNGTTDGIYRGVFTPADGGEYEIRLIARAKTFSREKRLVLSLPPRPEPPPVLLQPHTGPVAGEIDWMAVLIRFGIINLCFSAVVAAVVLLRRGLVRRRDDPAAEEARR